MKKILIICSLMLGFLTYNQAQDLINNAQSGRTSEVVTTKENTLGQYINQRALNSEFPSVALFSYDIGRQSNTYRSTVKEAVYLDLEMDLLQAFLANPQKDLSLEIPVNGRSNITLELSKSNILGKDFKITTSSGKLEYLNPSVLFYQGIVQGNPSSIATMSVFEDYVRILIADQQGNYVLGPLANQKRSYILYNERNLATTSTFDCHTDELPQFRHSMIEDIERQSFQTKGDCVEIYVECDFAMYLTFGSNTAAVANFVLALFNEVATLYRIEQISIEVSQIMIWTSTDPYVSGTNTSTVLELFGENLQNNYDGRLAHLLSTRGLGGGIAWVDVLCESYYTFNADFDGDGEDELHHAGPYGVSAVDPFFSPVPTYSWSVEVVTHELGHNFGSRHTHACVWNGDNTQIDDCGNAGGSGDGVFDDDDDGVADDGCFNPFSNPAQVPIIPADGGTIMSYCHLTSVGIDLSQGFGPQPGNLIRQKVADANCLKEDCSCDEFLDRTINGNPIASAIYTASNSITSSGDATGDNVVVFRAGNYVELNPGFEANDLFIAEVVDTLCQEFESFVQPSDRFLVQHQGGKQRNEMHLFPNPTSDQINIQYDLETSAEVEIQLLNQYGQLLRQILRKQEQEKGPQQLRIDLNNLSNSVYYIVLKTEQRTEMKPFVVNNL